MAELNVTDLYLVSALRLHGLQPQRVSRDGHRATWSFAETAQARRLVEAYYAHELMVDAINYAEHIRSAKGEAMNIGNFGGA